MNELEKILMKKTKTKTKKSIYDVEWINFLESLTDLYGKKYIEDIDNESMKKEFIKKESVDDIAILSKIGYMYTDYFLNRENRKYNIEELNDMSLSWGYKIDNKLSIYDIMVFYNKEKNNYYIVHRGTQPSSRTGVADLLTDAKLFLTGKSQRMENRLDETEDIIKLIKRKNPESTISLGGHSLGATTSSYAMTSPYVLNNVNELITLNGFYGGLVDIYQNNMNELDDEDIMKLNEKTTHHRMEGDIISSEYLKTIPFGELLTYQLKEGDFETKPLNKYAHDLGHFFKTDLNPLIETTSEMNVLQENLDVVQEISYSLFKDKTFNFKLESKGEEILERFNELENKYINQVEKEMKNQRVIDMLETINKQGFNNIQLKAEDLQQERMKEIEETDESLPLNNAQSLNINPFSLCALDPTLEGCENFY